VGILISLPFTDSDFLFFRLSLSFPPVVRDTMFWTPLLKSLFRLFLPQESGLFSLTRAFSLPETQAMTFFFPSDAPSTLPKPQILTLPNPPLFPDPWLFFFHIFKPEPLFSLLPLPISPFLLVRFNDVQSGAPFCPPWPLFLNRKILSPPPPRRRFLFSSPAEALCLENYFFFHPNSRRFLFSAQDFPTLFFLFFPDDVPFISGATIMLSPLLTASAPDPADP